MYDIESKCYTLELTIYIYLAYIIFAFTYFKTLNSLFGKFQIEETL